MKIYIVKSYNNGERHTIEKTHGLFENKKSAQEAIPKIWNTIFKDSWGKKPDPTTKTKNEWIQKWGDMNGYWVRIIEIETNKTYIDIDPMIYDPNKERLKEIK